MPHHKLSEMSEAAKRCLPKGWKWNNPKTTELVNQIQDKLSKVSWKDQLQPPHDGIEKGVVLPTKGGENGPTFNQRIPMGIKINHSTDEAKLNKTERAYLSILRTERYSWIGIQCLTLKLADDCRYTPDLITIHTGLVQAREVKGFWRDDAKVKIKV